MNVSVKKYIYIYLLSSRNSAHVIESTKLKKENEILKRRGHKDGRTTGIIFQFGGFRFSF